MQAAKVIKINTGLQTHDDFTFLTSKLFEKYAQYSKLRSDDIPEISW